MRELTEKVTEWAAAKGLLKPENAPKQMLKVMEEVGETAAALARANEAALKDGIGDSFVTLIILANQCGFTPEECLQAAWDEIKDRKGQMKDGVFVKEADLKVGDGSLKTEDGRGKIDEIINSAVINPMYEYDDQKHISTSANQPISKSTYQPKTQNLKPESK